MEVVLKYNVLLENNEAKESFMKFLYSNKFSSKI
jgi:hypothetical protein